MNWIDFYELDRFATGLIRQDKCSVKYRENWIFRLIDQYLTLIKLLVNASINVN